MKSANTNQFKLSELISGLDVDIKGDLNCLITGVSPLQQATPGNITFLSNRIYKKYLAETKASVVILSQQDAADCPVTAVITNNPYYIYSKIAAYFSSDANFDVGIHETAIVDETCEIAESVQIGAYCVIGKNVRIAKNSVIGANTVIEDDVIIGHETIISPKVFIGKRVRIGSRTCIASGAVIGSDGFGFANHNGRWHKVPQLGTVEIGDDVDIGANTTIDRGAVENTIIEDGVKLDNQVQIAHNVRIGANTIIAGCVGIAGSAIIGKNCMIGGGCCINGHIEICDNTMLTGMTGVPKSIKEPGIYSSGVVGAVPTAEFRRNNVRFARLGNTMQRLRELEATVKKLTEESP